MKKTNDKKALAVCAEVAILSGAMLAGGIVGNHQSEANYMEITAETDLEKKRAKQNQNFWKVMEIITDVMAFAAGMAGGFLIKDAFNLGKK